MCITHACCDYAVGYVLPIPAIMRYRLTSCRLQNMSFALKFPSPSINGSAGAGGSGSVVNSAEHEWLMVASQPARFEFKRTEDDIFKCVVPRLSTFVAGMKLKFATVPGLANGLTFTVPDMSVGNALAIAVKLDAPPEQSSIFVTGLQQQNTSPQPEQPMAQPPHQPPPVQQPAPMAAQPPTQPSPVQQSAAPQPFQMLSPSPLRPQVAAQPVPTPETPQPPGEVVADPTPSAMDSSTGAALSPHHHSSDADEDADGTATQPASPQSEIVETPRAPERGMRTRQRKVSALSAMHAELPLMDSTPDETNDGGWVVGDRVLAVGFHPSGSKAWFRAEVIGFRARFPPITVRYYAALDGCTLPLALPRPCTAYLLSRDIKRDKTAGGGKQDADSDDSSDDEDHDDAGGSGEEHEEEGNGNDPNGSEDGGEDGGSDAGSDGGGEEDGGETGDEQGEEINSETSDGGGDDCEKAVASGEPPPKRKKVSYCLVEIPVSFQADLSLFEEHRTIEINRLRARSACVPITATHDVANCRRFLGWLSQQGRVQESSDLLVTVFGSAIIASLAEDWLESLRERKIMASTQAKYISSVYLLTSFVFETCRPSIEALHLPVHPTVMLKNLRSQCEKRARQERRYSTSITAESKWLDWPSVQTTRVRAIEAYRSCPVAPRPKKMRLLTDVLLLHLHSCQPPGSCLQIEQCFLVSIVCQLNA